MEAQPGGRGCSSYNQRGSPCRLMWQKYAAGTVVKLCLSQLSSVNCLKLISVLCRYFFGNSVQYFFRNSSVFRGIFHTEFRETRRILLKSTGVDTLISRFFIDIPVSPPSQVPGSPVRTRCVQHLPGPLAKLFNEGPAAATYCIYAITE